MRQFKNRAGTTSLLLLLSGVSLSAQTSSFERVGGPTLVESLPGAYSVAVGEVDREGKADAVVSTANGIFLMKGGDFPQGRLLTSIWPAQPPAGSTPNLFSDLALADFDEDKINDLAAAVVLQKILVVLKGNGDGSFRELTRLPIDSSTQISRRTAGLVAADLNADGHVDLAVSQQKSIALFLGNGNGTFQTARESAVGELPKGLLTADFNGDRIPDLASVSTSGISILLGAGNGSFQPESRFSAGATGSAFATGDFNKDGKPDLVTADSQFVVFLIGKGDGTFTPKAPIEHTLSAVSATAVDLNGDQVSDLITGNYYGGITVFLSQPDGSVAKSSTIPSLGDVFSVAVADVVGDSKPDIVASSYSSSTLQIAAGLGNGQFAGPVYFGDNQIQLQSGVAKAARAPDLLALLIARKAIAVVRRATGPVTLVGLTDYPVDGQMADFNRDGVPDIVVLTARTLNAKPEDDIGLAIHVFAGRGDGTFAAPASTRVTGTTVTTDTAPLRGIAVGDFNGDGVPDVMLPNTLAGQIQLYAGKPDGSVREASNVTATNLTRRDLSRGITSADFNGDGVEDLALLSLPQDENNHRAYVYLMNQGGQLLSVSSYAVATAVSFTNPQYLLAGDFNGDRKTDLAVTSNPYYFDVPPSISVLLNSGQSFSAQSPVNPLPLGNARLIFTTADFDVDGKDDVLALQASDTRNQAGLILSGQADGTLKSSAVLAGLTSPAAVAAGNWDDDQNPDLAVLDGSEGNVLVLRNRMGPQAPSVLTMVSAASLREGDVAPDSIASAFGDGLAADTAIAADRLPVTLGGTSVNLTDAAGRVYPAGLFFVSPGQINLLIPPAMAFGTAVSKVTRDGKVVAEGLVNIGPVAPAFFTANANGKGVPAALALRVRTDGSRTNEPVYECPSAGNCVPRPIDVRAESGEVYLQLFGTGIRGCPNDARVLVGATALPILSAGPQGQYPGLDQVNVQLPATLSGTGATDLVLQLNCGRSSSPVLIHIR